MHLLDKRTGIWIPVELERSGLKTKCTKDYKKWASGTKICYRSLSTYYIIFYTVTPMEERKNLYENTSNIMVIDYGTILYWYLIYSVFCCFNHPAVPLDNNMNSNINSGTQIIASTITSNSYYWKRVKICIFVHVLYAKKAALRYIQYKKKLTKRKDKKSKRKRKHIIVCIVDGTKRAYLRGTH